MSWILVIDFGTSFTVAVAKQPGRAAEVIEIGGERRVPSVILVEPDGQVLVGRVADDLASSRPGGTLRAPKARLGDHTAVVLDGRPHQILDLVADLLRSVYADAVRHMGSEPTQVRLTHPAMWNRPHLNRLLEAAQRAGMPTCELVPEPVGAALSYATEVGLANGAYIVVYDLGGGTFDTAVVAANTGGLAVVGRPSGDQSIGGELFDEILFDHVVEQLPADAAQSIAVGSDESWVRAASALRSEVRRAKETLSSSTYVTISIALPAGSLQHTVTRAQFEGLIRQYVDETISVLVRCVTESGVDPNGLAAIYLVGGATRSPLVEQMVQAAFPATTVSRRGDPKAAVAIGAAQALRPNAITDAGMPAPPPASPVVPPPTPPVVQPSAPQVHAVATSTIPIVNTPQRRTLRRLGLVASVIVLVLMAAAIALFTLSGDDKESSSPSIASVTEVDLIETKASVIVTAMTTTPAVNTIAPAATTEPTPAETSPVTVTPVTPSVDTFTTTTIGELPHVVQLTEQDAEIALRNSGYVPTFGRVCSGSVGEGIVRQVVRTVNGQQVVVDDLQGVVPEQANLPAGTELIVKVGTGQPC